MPSSSPDDTRTTYEIAKLCPKCGQPGRVTTTTPVRDRPGVRLETIECENELCLWYKTGGWVVQINRDGSIPDRHRGPKEFPDMKLPESSIQNYLDRLRAEDEGAH